MFWGSNYPKMFWLLLKIPHKSHNKGPLVKDLFSVSQLWELKDHGIVQVKGKKKTCFFILPGCLCLWPLWSKEAFPFLVSNATLQSTDTPSNTRKILSSPRPCHFIIAIAILPNLSDHTLHSAPCVLVPLSGAPLPLRWYPVFSNKMLLMCFLVHELRWGLQILITSSPRFCFSVFCLLLKEPKRKHNRKHLGEWLRKKQKQTIPFKMKHRCIWIKQVLGTGFREKCWIFRLHLEILFLKRLSC